MPVSKYFSGYKYTTRKEARANADRISELLGGDVVYVIKVSGRDYIPATGDVLTKDRRVYDTRCKIQYSDAKLYGGIQDRGIKQGGETGKSNRFRLRTNVLKLGIDNRSRWLSEVSRYYETLHQNS